MVLSMLGADCQWCLLFCSWADISSLVCCRLKQFQIQPDQILQLIPWDLKQNALENILYFLEDGSAIQQVFLDMMGRQTNFTLLYKSQFQNDCSPRVSDVFTSSSSMLLRNRCVTNWRGTIQYSFVVFVYIYYYKKISSYSGSFYYIY